HIILKRTGVPDSSGGLKWTEEGEAKKQTWATGNQIARLWLQGLQQGQFKPSFLAGRPLSDRLRLAQGPEAALRNEEGKGLPEEDRKPWQAFVRGDLMRLDKDFWAVDDTLRKAAEADVRQWFRPGTPRSFEVKPGNNRLPLVQREGQRTLVRYDMQAMV